MEGPYIMDEPFTTHIIVFGAILSVVGAAGFAATIFAMLAGVNASLTGPGVVYTAVLVIVGMVAIVSGASLEARAA